MDFLQQKMCSCGTAPAFADVGGNTPLYEICCFKCNKTVYASTVPEVYKLWDRVRLIAGTQEKLF